MSDRNASHRPSAIHTDLDRGTILLQINEAKFNLAHQGVLVEGIVLRPKVELHITVVSGDAGRLLAARLAENPAEKLALKAGIPTWDWRYY